MFFNGADALGERTPFIGCTKRCMSVVRSEFSTTCTWEKGTASESLKGICVFDVSKTPIC